MWNKFKDSALYIKIRGFLKQGLSPRQLALTIVISTLIGIMPLLIVNTWIIGAFSVVFRLNLPLALFINYGIWPIHVILIIPFIKFGTWISGASMTTLTLTHFQEAFSDSVLLGIQDMGVQVAYGILGWAILCIPLALVSFFFLENGLKTYLKK
ncbi:MAG: DUF2062 domain-containing protein [Saprospiraceae bacterium]